MAGYYGSTELTTALTMTRNPERTRDRILSAALKEFSAKGYAGARVDAIARRAKANKRMLYHYFGKKDAVFREVVRRTIGRRVDVIRSTPDDPVESLPYWQEIMCRDLDWVRLTQWEALSAGERPVVAERERRAAFAHGLEKIRHGQRLGYLSRALDPAQLLLSMIALTTFPVAFPQITRLVTGSVPSDLGFHRRRAAFLRALATHLQPRHERVQRGV